MNNNDQLNQLSARQILSQTLTLSNFQGDKEKYISEFLQLYQQKTINKLLETVDKKKQTKIINDLKNIKEPDEIESTLKKHFDAKKIYIISAEISGKLFQEILEGVLPLLTLQQKNNLKEYFTKLAQPKNN